MRDADLSGTVLDGRYQVIEPIADGAMGSVYRGERIGLGRAVAIKIMHQELPDELASRQRFEREAKLMALLEHPNCVSVMDFGVHDDKPFLVMDLVRGTSLIEILDKTPQLDVARSADIIRQVLSGLAHAHELGIVHRDIKPANIMISEKAGLGSQVRILDFGLARLTESSTKLTTGIVVGTPNYMAPEQCKGSDIDARTDLYAVGVMLFEMLTGRKPFVSDDPIQVVRKHLLEPPPTLASVEPRIDFGELEAVVAKAMAKAPADRFDSAVEMAKAVEAAAAKQTRMSAAALFARAVPETAQPVGSQLATMSGWNVPPADASASIARSGAGSGSAPGSSAVPASGPVPSSGPVQSYGTPASGPVGTAADASAGAMPPPSSLPPLPTAAPYVPPPAPPPFVPRTRDSSPSVESAGPGIGGPVAEGQISSPGSGPIPGHESGPGSSPVSGPIPGHASGPVSAPVSGPIPGSASGPNPSSGSIPGAPPTALPNVASAPISNAAAPISNAAAPISSAAALSNAAAPHSSTPISGAPVRAPATNDRPIPQLPFTKKQLVIGAGGLVGLILLIAIVAGGDSKKAPSSKTDRGSATVTKNDPPSTDAATEVISKANTLIASEDYEAATSMLRRARKDHPENAEIAYLAGRAYFGQLYWTDGVESFRAAIKLDPAYREDPDLLKTVLKGFLTTPDVDDRIVSFMRHDIGVPMRPYLEETAEKHPKKALRSRARNELDAGR